MSKSTYDCIVFDLDGTLSDPAVGITTCINHSLTHHGYDEISVDKLLPHIGPPLDEAFNKLTTSMDEKHIHSLVSKYRERYASVGYSENKLYDGIVLALDGLEASGMKLGVCTSKRADFAEKILEMFGIRKHFEFVSGGDIGIPKWRQLEELLHNRVISQNSIMVGDRGVDLTAAHRNGLHSAGVLWGYGSREELAAESPQYLFRSTTELTTLSG